MATAAAVKRQRRKLPGGSGGGVGTSNGDSSEKAAVAKTVAEVARGETALAERTGHRWQGRR